MFKRIAPILILAALALGLAAAAPSARAQQSPEIKPAPAAAAPASAPVVAEPPARLPDRDGSLSGTIADVTAATAGKPTIEELGAAVGHNKIAINLMWTMLCGFLVMFMQPGFAAVETGFTQRKNAAHTMAMNLLIYPLGMIGFYVCGFAIMMGGVGGLATLGGYAGLDKEIGLTLGGKFFGLMGGKGFFLTGSSYDFAIFAMFLFQMVFMDTTATIPTGALAERWKFSSFFIYGLAIGTIMYPFYGNWVWGGGWLSQLGKNFGLGHGHVDFAGSSVVHLSGGVIAIVSAKMLGPRIGKYNKDGSSNAIPGHNLPMAVLGTFILCFGWFGFNAGSTLAGGDYRLSVVAVNTMMAGTTGSLASCLWMWWFRTKKPDPSMICNGLLAGLVAITAPCAFVNSVSACIIGLIAGVMVVEAVYFVDGVLKIDDPVGAISVHGCGGALGCICLGLFADGTYGAGLNGVDGAVRGLFYGDGSQLIAQCIGVATNILFYAPLTWLVFTVIDKIVGNRVPASAEIEGLDIPEMGVRGYES
jgi:Amt family ammonium transporter